MILFVIAMSKRSSIIGEKINCNWFDGHATFYGDMRGGATMRKYNHTVITKGGRNLAISLKFFNSNVQF